MATLAVPNPKLTPGATFPTATAATVCKPGYTHAVRHVTNATKRAVCRAYGVANGCPGPDWEVDHFVSLEIGGSNDERNLWPQPIKQAREKDKAETRFHRAVCAGAMTLDQAQQRVRDPKEWH